ncbi:hypothetical protein NT05HA_0787 [Aggregatibacter aphrophilus NJ8700]|nr:hypothetical protein NT05HA_0787 [Aggregatibacter aphrophilus NJ8700]
MTSLLLGLSKTLRKKTALLWKKIYKKQPHFLSTVVSLFK